MGIYACLSLCMDSVNGDAKRGGQPLTLSIFLCCILFLRRWAIRPKSLQKNMVMVTAIIGRAISQNRISDRPWTDHMKSKFIPWVNVGGQVAPGQEGSGERGRTK